MRRPPAERGFARRSLRFLWIGAAVGAIAGAVAGAIVGVIAFDSAGGLWGSILAAAVFAGGIGAFVAGLSSLGPPRPGHELAPDDQDPVEAPSREGAGTAGGPLVVEERGSQPSMHSTDDPTGPRDRESSS